MTKAKDRCTKYRGWRLEIKQLSDSCFDLDNLHGRNHDTKLLPHKPKIMTSSYQSSYFNQDVNVIAPAPPAD